MIKSEGYAELAPLFSGLGKAGLASLPLSRHYSKRASYDLQKNIMPLFLHSEEVAPNLTTGEGELTLKAWMV